MMTIVGSLIIIASTLYITMAESTRTPNESREPV
jgi:hypothetical protein